MCGICGFYIAGPAPDLAARLERAKALLAHRGPDDHGTYLDNGVGLGHRRLSIIDVAAGQQPMPSANGRYSIVFNGEIYNFQELARICEGAGHRLRTHSDTEVLLTLYSMEGSACLQRLMGMFAFAIWDRQERTLFLARDRLGVKPLYYGVDDDGVYFASTLPAVLAMAPHLAREADCGAMAEYFARQYILAPRTPFRRVYKLPPGHSLFVRQPVSIGAPERYWFPETTAPAAATLADASETLRHLMQDAVRLRLISERPTGAFLSGGLDSSITVSEMVRLSDGPVKTFAVGFADDKMNEAPYAREVARHLGTEHHEAIVDYTAELPQTIRLLLGTLGEPFGDQSLVPSYYVAKMAAQDLTVVLTGDGADESWAGYKRHYQAALLDTILRYGLRRPWLAGRRLTVAVESLLGKRRRLPVNQLDRVLLEGDFSPQALAQKASGHRTDVFHAPALMDAAAAYTEADTHAAHPGWDTLTRFLYYDLQTFLAGSVLPKMDTATMLNSIEARSPFLDHRLVEFALSLPATFKMHHLRTGKYLLKATYGSRLPSTVSRRPKMGFTPPTGRWLRGPLKQWAGDLLHSERCRHLLNQPMLLQHFDEHQRGTNHTRLLWLCSVFLEWADQHQVSV